MVAIKKTNHKWKPTNQGNAAKRSCLIMTLVFSIVIVAFRCYIQLLDNIVNDLEHKSQTNKGLNQFNVMTSLAHNNNSENTLQPRSKQAKSQTSNIPTNTARDIAVDIPCQHDFMETNPANSISLHSTWHDIDTLLSTSYPNAKVSGGIFLYPRQQSMLPSIVKQLAAWMKQSYNRPLRLCETGFGSGHSAAMFLESSPNVEVYTFDKFDRPYQLEVVKMLSAKYPNRLRHFVGNSCRTVPITLSAEWQEQQQQEQHDNQQQQERYQCDFLHGSSLCRSDNIDLVEHSPCGTLLTSTAMNSLTDKAVYFGKNAQWRKLRDLGCISNITCFTEEDMVLDRDFVFNAKGNTMSHKFCFAVTTGKCQKDLNGAAQGNMTKWMLRKEGDDDEAKSTTATCAKSVPLYEFTRSLHIESICPEFQVSVPN